MPRDGSGNYTLPPVNPVVDGTIIDVNWANPTLQDIAVQLNNVLTRDGVLGFTNAAKIIDGSLTSPGLQFIAESNTGVTRPIAQSFAIVVNGVEIARFTPTGENVTGNINASGNIGAAGNLGVSGSATIVGNIQAGSIQSTAGGLMAVPIGVSVDFCGPAANIPPGYFECNGQALSRTTYPFLFGAIGTTWGAGDGTTTFNVPALQRYTTIGAGGTPSGTGVPANTVGSRGGNEGIILSIPQMPTHSHSITDVSHNHAISDPGHTHSATDSGHTHVTTFGSFGAGAAGGGAAVADPGYGNSKGIGTSLGIASVAIGTSGTGVLSNPAGSGIGGTNTAGGNGVTSLMQPSAVMTKIIRAF